MLNGTDGAVGGHDALGLEVLHEDVEAAVLLADEVGLGHLDVLEEDLGGVLGLQADFRDELSGQTLGVGFYEQEADALVGLLCIRIGPDGDHEEVGDHTVGDEGLAAVDEIVVAHVHGAALDVGEVGAEVGLGHAHGHDGLAADYLRQPLLALLLGAVFGNVGGDDVAG